MRGAAIRMLGIDRKSKRERKSNDAKQTAQEETISLDQDDVDVAREVLNLVRSRIETRKGYVQLLCMIIFFMIYCSTLLSQQPTEDSFAIESRWKHAVFLFSQVCLRITDCLRSIVLSNIMAALPTNGQFGYLNSPGPGASGMLTSPDQLLQWISETIVPALYQDAVCGDGNCDADEQPAVGRFGW